MKQKILITSPRGLSSFLKEEVEQLGYPVLWAGTSGVQTEGEFTDTMYLNLHLRTAHHVLYLVSQFTCRSPDQLYRELNRFPWESLIPANEYLSVTSNAEHPSIKDTRFVNMKSKDAIVDRIAARKGRRPDSGPERTGAVVHVYWRNEQCMVYLDTSGESLSKRGYRRIPGHAPMQETLAAGVVLATNWSGGEHFVNPMCGSGTLAIEAALIGANRAPGLTRNNFGFMHTLLYDGACWQSLRKEALGYAKKELGGRLIATDISEHAVAAARKNAEEAGVSSLISFSVADFTVTQIPEGKGVVVFNPEYGIRMGEEKELENVYRGIGSFLKNKCQGYRGYVFTGNTTLAGKVGLKAKRRFPFQSGKLDCRLYYYELYKGSRDG